MFLQSSAKAWESFHSHEWTYFSLPHEILAADDDINTTGKESEPSYTFKEESSLNSAHNLLRVSILRENLWLSPRPCNSTCHNETASHSTYFLVKSTTGKDGGYTLPSPSWNQQSLYVHRSIAATSPHFGADSLPPHGPFRLPSSWDSMYCTDFHTEWSIYRRIFSLSLSLSLSIQKKNKIQGSRVDIDMAGVVPCSSSFPTHPLFPILPRIISHSHKAL